MSQGTNDMKMKKIEVLSTTAFTTKTWLHRNPRPLRCMEMSNSVMIYPQ